MRKKSKMILLFCWYFLFSCNNNEPPSPDIVEDVDTVVYNNLYDPIQDVGQYSLLEVTVKPKKYWSCVSVLENATRNELNKTEKTQGLQYHLLCQSIAGLTNSAVDNGKSEISVWLYDHGQRESYTLSKNALGNMGIKEQGMQTGIELACNSYGDSEGVHIQLKGLFDGYVLTDVNNNPESNIVASVASHVYNAIIVDVRDKVMFENAGYKMKYDASKKTTKQAWLEFKDKCSNKALVVMPVQTGELRDFAIKNNLFVLNVNKIKDSSSQGQNIDVFEEVLAWLEPGAPVYGWEQGISEDIFVNRASMTGHPWMPSDWMYNIPLTALKYKERQTSVLAKVQNPTTIDFTKRKKFVSYFLSDGDNVQWMMGDFSPGFYLDENANSTKMGFGLPVNSLSMMAPEQFANLLNRQSDSCTIVESLGGGYLYADNYGISKNRGYMLKQQAERVAASMRQHRVKVLGLMAHNVKSADAIEGYKAFAEANDQLEGIVAIQYSPYAGGEGEIFWVKNKNGYNIPVITAKYSIWNHGTNQPRQGSPTYIANKLKSDSNKESFSLISVHAWSSFVDIGNSTSETDEMKNGGNKKGASAAALCSRRFDNTLEVVRVQELIWRVRMYYYPRQTELYLKSIKKQNN